MTITAEYLPGIKNTRADHASREVPKLSSGWIIMVFHAKIETVGSSRNKSFPFQFVSPCSKVCKVAPRSLRMNVCCLSVRLEECTTIFLPSLCPNRKGLRKSNSENF